MVSQKLFNTLTSSVAVVPYRELPGLLEKEYPNWRSIWPWVLSKWMLHFSHMVFSAPQTAVSISIQRNWYHYFSKWPEAYAIPNQEASRVVETLVTNYFCCFGVPWELHSDQGSNFESCLVQEVLQSLGVCKTCTTPLHPQLDSMVERYIKTVKEHLQEVNMSHQRDWDMRLPILLACRSSTHDTMGLTPANLVFGREHRLPCDLRFGSPPAHHWPRGTLWIGYMMSASCLPTSEAGQRPNENSLRPPGHLCGLPGGWLSVTVLHKLHEREVTQAATLMRGPYRVVTRINIVV
jgi:hypothetical protein